MRNEIREIVVQAVAGTKDITQAIDELVALFERKGRYIDKNGKALEVGSIIDLHQTVNGENLFIIMSVEPLDIRYGYDLHRVYEYDQEGLLIDRYGEVEWEIIGNKLK